MDANHAAAKLFEAIDKRVEWAQKGFPGSSDGNTRAMISTMVNKLAEVCGRPGLMHKVRDGE